MIAAVIALALALAASLASLVWLARKAITKTEYAAKVDVEKAHLFQADAAKGAALTEERSRADGLGRSLAEVQARLADALEELHAQTESKLVSAAPGDVPALVERMLETRRSARREVSRASGHPAEPATVPVTRTASVGEITDLK